VEGIESHVDFKGLDKSVRLKKIIKTATELFHRKGYRSTTLEDVATELGITKAALYHYVSSKENLLSIIYIQALENIFRNVDKILGMDLPPDEKLKMIIRNHIKEIIIPSLPMYAVFFSEENQLPESDFKKIQEEKKKYTKILEQIIGEGISQGLFRATDARLLAFAIIGMCNWVYKWYKVGNSNYSPDQIVEHFMTLLERGYLQDDGEERTAQPTNQKVARKKRKSPSRNETYKKLKVQCERLMELVERLEEGERVPIHKSHKVPPPTRRARRAIA